MYDLPQNDEFYTSQCMSLLTEDVPAAESPRGLSVDPQRPRQSPAPVPTPGACALATPRSSLGAMAVGAQKQRPRPPHTSCWGWVGRTSWALPAPPLLRAPPPRPLSPRPTAGGPGAHGHVFVGSDEVPWELKLISFGVSLDPHGAAMRLRPGAGVTGCPGCAVILETNLKHVSFTVEAKTPVVCRLLERTQRAPGPAGASAPAGKRAAPGCTPTGSVSVSRAAGSHGRLGRQGTREGRPEGSVSPQARRPAHPRG